VRVNDLPIISGVSFKFYFSFSLSFETFEYLCLQKNANSYVPMSNFDLQHHRKTSVFSRDRVTTVRTRCAKKLAVFRCICCTTFCTPCTIRSYIVRLCYQRSETCYMN